MGTETQPEQRSVEPAPSPLHNLLALFFEGNLTPFIIDAGAYRGDFTGELLDRFPGARALLMEPTPATYRDLQARFAGNAAVEIVNVALGAERGSANFYLAEHAYQNSLLPPTDTEAKKITVPVESLDHLRQSWPTRTRIDLLKIDAQGHDLRILQGAAQTIAADQPAILVEVIFVPLYEGQNSYYAILDFMRQCSYELAGIFQPHTTEDGLLAFADLLFVPTATHGRLCRRASGGYVYHDVEQLKRRADDLQTVCDERLRVIEELDAALRHARKPKPPPGRSWPSRLKGLLRKIGRAAVRRESH